MVLKLNKYFAGVIALVLVASSFAFMTLVNAQEGDNAGSGSGLSISPTRTDLSLVPGDSRTITHSVKNVTQNTVTVQPVLNDFEADDLTGNPKLVGDASQVSAYSLREFLTAPEKFDLASGEEKELSIVVTVPSSAAPGAYFGSMLYRASPPGADGDGQVALIASVGSLILLEVPGDIKQQIEIDDVSAFFNNKSGSIFTKKPDNIGVTISNLGNSFSQPFGKVQVEDWRGNQVFIYELNNGSPRGNILPDSTRLFLDELNNVETKTVNGQEVVEKTSPIKWPGRYKVIGNISHGSTGEIFEVAATFWYIPVWLIIALAGLLVVLVAGSYIMFNKYVTKTTRKRK